MNDKKVNKNSIRYREYIIKKAAVCKIAAFLIVLAAGAVVSMLLPLRPTESVTEKRKLSAFPKLTTSDFLDGTYFKNIDTWFADTFPMRDSLMMCSERLNSMYGIRKNAIHGEVVIGDEIPDVDIDENELKKPQELPTSTLPVQTSEPQPQETVGNYDYENVTVNPSDIGTSIDGTDGTDLAKEGESLGSIYIVGGSAYNYYSFSQAETDRYVAMINNLAATLSDKAHVYSMVIPTSIDITLDDATRNSVSSSNQRKAILYMYSKMSSNVGKCYLYDLLREHRQEYIYFRTDHHWTALGAYYAYTAFMEQLGREALPLDKFTRMDMGKFQGSFYTQTRAESLGNNPDQLIAYVPPTTNQYRMINKQYDWTDYNIVTNVSGWNQTSKYSAFIGGDNPLSVLNNPQIKDGSSCLVVKESFGNAMAPFMVESFENVYIVDYRYYKGTVSDLVAEYNIDTVLILNNILATSTDERVNEMMSVCK